MGAGAEVTVGLGWRDHLEGLRAALLAFTRNAERAGMAATVPTTPDWTVRRLVAHQGMVHRWAAAQLRGEQVDTDALEQQGVDSADPLEWLRDGAVELASAVSRAGEGSRAPVFLADAGRPRDFWARRQCHETTIHAVDALAAQLGRCPRAADTWIDPAIARDGIDELLTGFLPRPVSRLRAPEPMTVGVEVDGQVGPGAGAWLVRVGPEPPRTTRLPRGSDEVAAADVVLRGSPVALYLTLWNRSLEVSPEGADDDWSWADAAVRWRSGASSD